ncbi:1-deoxy-D-xylulose-5-phosphate reductoisomerase [Desulfobulbus rhabdoformis]|uniref:1-deoxy-D-xylulose-5-phosphate reductoisomerase n=1 Tax=Desulfobulbus rhabdoformis TaxID=34032 RepID=UPI0019669BAD|nr:1-deoxy-D-xylulose-5-phosphate reductoisomerase [Desulfobulbus rhabdoformis]MBM9614603.1 1-deoxy-D-xylulose-5-phosphate reductoisomerase [Desulfobulbus rhabdoformis]
MKRIALLGSTGSIGTNVLAIARQFPEQFQIVGLSAGSNVELLTEQVLEFNPQCVSIGRPDLAAELANTLPASYRSRILSGGEGNTAIATLADADMVVTAVVGAVGLLPTLAAIRAGKDIGLANKETLVMAGRLVMEEVQRHGVRLLPIDSEHSAIFQALEAGRSQDVDKLILTASGGPFRDWDLDALRIAQPEQALAHPNWSMGRKISIDSATLMNKGLEVIEASWLFSMEPERIEVVVHPQSIVHSLVEFVDGSVVAQLGIPDMRIPIGYALTYPKRLPLALPRLSLSQCSDLSFEQPDMIRFPALGLAFDALRAGGVQPAVLNAANEVAVDAFLEGKIGYLDIARTVEACLSQAPLANELDLDAILAADAAARSAAHKVITAL